jgi:hypothetical protein
MSPIYRLDSRAMRGGGDFNRQATPPVRGQIVTNVTGQPVQIAHPAAEANTTGHEMIDETAATLPAHERLFADLGAELGIEGLAFNEAGVCIMSFDEAVLRFEYQPERDEILVSSEIAELQPGQSAEMFQDLLALNAASAASGAGTIGFDPERGKLFWFDHISPRSVDQAGFQAWLQAAIARIEACPDLVRQMQQANRAGEEDEPDASDGMMIRV